MAEGEDAPKPDFRNGFPVLDLPDGGKITPRTPGHGIFEISGHFQKFLSVLLASFAKFSAESGSCHDGWVGRYRVTGVS